MARRMYKKGLVVGIIILFIGVSITISTGKIDTAKTNINDGSLLGYVKDTSGNPIEGALVKVHFHETFEEDYIDSTGFYHVTNIPVCYCLKNATCSKDGYKTEWVLLSITENTTHDFVLTSGNQAPDKPIIKGKWAIHEPGPYDYKFKAVDPDGDDIRYFINWDDGNTEWTDYYASGEEVIVSHTWSMHGAFHIRTRANDTHGALGPWGTINQSSKSTDDNNKNKDSANAPEEIYANSDCYVFGRVEGEALKVNGILTFRAFWKGDICLGGYSDYWGTVYTDGWICTIGEQDSWSFEGKFLGEGLGNYFTNDGYGGFYKRMVAIKGFKGLAIGAFFLAPNCLFFGKANHVKIITK